MMRKTARYGGGICCIAVGVLLGFVPFVPGIFLVLFGLNLLGVPFANIETLKGWWQASKAAFKRP